MDVCPFHPLWIIITVVLYAKLFEINSRLHAIGRTKSFTVHRKYDDDSGQKL